MAGSTTKSVQTKRFGKIGGSTYSQTRNCMVDYVWNPNKANGGFLTLPNGSRFRRTTGWMKIHKWIELENSQYTTGISSGQYSNAQSASGGYAPDIMLSANSGNLKSSIGSLPSFNGSPLIPSEMRSEAATKALLKIVDQKAAIGEDLATMRQTVDLVRKPASYLYGGLKKAWNDKQLRPFLFKSLRDFDREGLPNFLAKRYLEYVYGWKPLVEDIYGIMDVMKQKGSKDLLLSGTGKSKQQCECPINYINDTSLQYKSEMGPVKETATVRCKIWGRIDPNCPGLRALSQLGLINPLSLAWELVPWSFVVDWFVPIGSTLSALTAPAGLIFVNGSQSVRNEFTAPYVHWDTRLDANRLEHHPASGKIRYDGYLRQELTQWPLPGFWANQNPFSGDRSLKALALAIVNLKNLTR
jgi:hypothetical protein